MKKLSKKYPSELVIHVHALALHGDYSQTLSIGEEKKIKKSVSLELKKVLKRVSRSPIEIRRLVYNEYYYHSGQYLKQYLLGRKHLKMGYNGNFSAGVGSSCLALELFKKGKKAPSQEYALKSLVHWESYKKDAVKVGGAFYVVVLWLVEEKEKAKKALEKIRKLDKFSSTLHFGYYRKYNWIAE